MDISPRDYDAIWAELDEINEKLLSREGAVERLVAERNALRDCLRYLVDVVHPHTLSMRGLLVLDDARALVARAAEEEEEARRLRGQMLLFEETGYYKLPPKETPDE